jgi:hypothetical protein
VRVVRRAVQVGYRVMSDTHMGWGHASFEAIAGKDHLPVPAGTVHTGAPPAEDPIRQDVPSQLHCMASTKSSVESSRVTEAPAPGAMSVP